MTPVSGWKLGMIWVFGGCYSSCGTGLPREACKITMPSTICIVVGPVYPDPQLVGDAMNADDVAVTVFSGRHDEMYGRIPLASSCPNLLILMVSLPPLVLMF